MKNLIFLMLIAVLIIPACKENPTEPEEKPAIKIDWKLVFKKTNVDTIYGDNNGISKFIGLGDISDANCLMIRINYRSEYRRYYLIPSFSGGSSQGGFSFSLYKDSYTKFDTIICRDNYEGYGKFYLNALNAKIIIDTVVVLKE